MYKKSKPVAVFFFILSITILLILIPFFTTVYNAKTYKTEFAKLNVYDALPRYNIEKIHEEVIHYLQGNNNANLDFFTEREKEHLKDVQVIMQITKNLLYLSYIFILLSILILMSMYKQRKELVKKIVKCLCYSSGIAILFSLLLIIFSLASFSISFELFHKLFFEENSYLFNPEAEKIVILYPQQLFFDIAIKILVKIIFSSTILFLLSYFILKKYYNTPLFKKKK